MKAKSMKAKTVIITITCVAVVCAALGVWGFPELTRASDEARRMAEAQEARPELTRVAQAVGASDADTRQQRRQLVRYADWVKVYQPTHTQQDEISRMIADGADVDILLDICRFWEDTDEPFTLVSQLYKARPDEEALAEFDDHLLWITGAYDRLKGKEDGALSVDEVLAYQRQGLSTSDVYVADRMSRGGADVREVLERRTAGQSWQEIILPEANETAAFGLDEQSDDAPVINGNDLLDSLILSRKTGRPPVDFLAAAQEGESVLDAYQREQTADTLNELTEIGLIPAEGGMKS